MRKLSGTKLQGIAEKMGSLLQLVGGQKTITEKNIEDTLKEVKSIMIDADVNLQVANGLIAKVKEQALGMKISANQQPGQQFIGLLATELVRLMGETQTPLIKRKDNRPTVILMLGLQGAGKTTASAKLARWMQTQGHSQKVLLVAADTFRPAAAEQLRTLGARMNVDVYSEEGETNPVAIARRGFAKAKAEGYEAVVVDTAGRQVVDARLMDELQQIKAALLPDEALLVVDAMTGQEAATLTLRFEQEVGITGALLTKLDGDSRGGAAVSVRAVSGKPIKFVGVGEGLDDLQPFYPERMAQRILGMGDVATLIEKAQGALDLDEAMTLNRKMQAGSFSFDDYLKQLQSVRSMGGLGSLTKMIPGAASSVTDEAIFAAEKSARLGEQLISHMTADERANPDLLAALNGSREMQQACAKRRAGLATRSNMTLREVETFLAQFNSIRVQMRRMMQGVDLDEIAKNPGASVPLGALPQKQKQKKEKLTRGGGGGFAR